MGWFMAVMVILCFAFGIFLFAVNVPTHEFLKEKCEIEMSNSIGYSNMSTSTSTSSSSTITTLVSGGGGKNTRGGTGTTASPDYRNFTCDDTPPYFWMKPS